MIGRRWAPVVATPAAFVLMPLSAHALQGCWGSVSNDGLVDSGPAPEVKVPDAGADSGFVGPSNVTCPSEAGAVPPPTCHVPWMGSGLSCPASGSTCEVTKNADGTSCGEALCLPLTTNTAPTYDFRMAALYIASPAILNATSIVASNVVSPALTLNAPTCGYFGGMSLFGNLSGSFNWLLSLDTSKKTLTTGGAPPEADPYGKGYCFVNETDKLEGGAAIQLQPVSIPVAINKNTVSTPTPLSGVLNIPIFQSSTMLAEPIILPLRGVQLTFTMSTDGNCIGDINPAWYAFAGGGSAGCNDKAPAQCPKWFTNGSLAGFITVADAANVQVKALNTNLCAVLETAGACSPTSPYINYCSKPAPGGSPTGCADSFWLSATFAANAVKINPTGPAPCKQ